MTQPLVKRDDTDLLTTEQAAQLMGHSRPYVAMLIDANKLKGGSVSEVGHRRVPRSSVLAWIKKANKKNKAGDANYKAAALEAGMYDIPEVQVVRIIAKGKRRYKGKNCSPY
jgi:excisionase family DNA binding protein